MQKIYLLDTNIVSEFLKIIPDPEVVALYKARKNLCAISSVTWQEIQFGLSKMPEGRRKNYIIQSLEEYKNSFQIIPYDEFAAEICGKSLGLFEKKVNRFLITILRLQPLQ